MQIRRPRYVGARASIAAVEAQAGHLGPEWKTGAAVRAALGRRAVEVGHVAITRVAGRTVVVIADDIDGMPEGIELAPLRRVVSATPEGALELA